MFPSRVINSTFPALLASISLDDSTSKTVGLLLHNRFSRSLSGLSKRAVADVELSFEDGIVGNRLLVFLGLRPSHCVSRCLKPNPSPPVTQTIAATQVWDAGATQVLDNSTLTYASGMLVNSFAGPTRNESKTGVGGILGASWQISEAFILNLFQAQMDSVAGIAVTSGLQNTLGFQGQVRQQVINR